jgi:hypothetical protein
MERICMTEPTYRVSFERDEGQGYDVGARVSVHPMDDRFRTIRLNPAGGTYLVTRCERIRDTTWQALRISLQLWIEPLAEAAAGSVQAADALADALLDALVTDPLAGDILASDARQ